MRNVSLSGFEALRGGAVMPRDPGLTVSPRAHSAVRPSHGLVFCDTRTDPHIFTFPPHTQTEGVQATRAPLRDSQEEAQAVRKTAQTLGVNGQFGEIAPTSFTELQGIHNDFSPPGIKPDSRNGSKRSPSTDQDRVRGLWALRDRDLLPPLSVGSLPSSD